jgi:hypothetical protein
VIEVLQVNAANAGGLELVKSLAQILDRAEERTRPDVA